MAERSLIHASNQLAFHRYLIKEHGAVKVEAKSGEIIRYLIDGKVVSFSQRLKSDHITTWGRGTELAKEFIKHQKETSDGKDLFPANRAGSDESGARQDR